MANIALWANEKGHTVTGTLLYKGEDLPLLGSFDWLVVMGGSMGANDVAQYPWLAREKKFIRQAVASGKIVLGICLGAQLISDSMGGKVTKNPQKEIGWYPVTLTDEAKSSPVFKALPSRFMAFHWHGDTFSIPQHGGRKLAYSDACDDQAFEIGRAIGLQFHLEFSKESIEHLIKNCGGELVSGPHVQDAAAIRAGLGNLSETDRLMHLLLDSIETEYGKNPSETA
jgi:GMP synthase-like glutamine amidotransferase